MMKLWIPFIMIFGMLPLLIQSWQKFAKLTKEERRQDTMTCLAVFCSGGVILLNGLALLLGALNYFVFGK